MWSSPPRLGLLPFQAPTSSAAAAAAAAVVELAFEACFDFEIREPSSQEKRVVAVVVVVLMVLVLVLVLPLGSPKASSLQDERV